MNTFVKSGIVQNLGFFFSRAQIGVFKPHYIRFWRFQLRLVADALGIDHLVTLVACPCHKEPFAHLLDQDRVEDGDTFSSGPPYT